MSRFYAAQRAPGANAVPPSAGTWPRTHGCCDLAHMGYLALAALIGLLGTDFLDRVRGTRRAA